MERASAASFTEPLTRTDALYFAGDRVLHGGFRGHQPQIRDRPGVVFIVQMLADLAFLGVGIRVLLGAVQRGRQQSTDAGDDTGPAAG